MLYFYDTVILLQEQQTKERDMQFASVFRSALASCGQCGAECRRASRKLVFYWFKNIKQTKEFPLLTYRLVTAPRLSAHRKLVEHVRVRTQQVSDTTLPLHQELVGPEHPPH